VEEQVISPRSIFQIIRRRPRILLIVALLGCALGLGYAVFVPPMPSAIALVLLPASPIGASGQPTQNVNTDVEVALSQPVLGSAGRAVGLALTYPDLQRLVSVTALTPDLLQITAQGKTVREAEALANEEADSFVRYSTSSSALAASLGVGAQVLQRATTATHPSPLRRSQSGALGALGGLMIGGLVAYVADRRDRRLRSRDDIAAAAGVQVLQSLSSRRRKKADDWFSMFEEWQPSLTDKARMRQLLGAMGFSLKGAVFQPVPPRARRRPGPPRERSSGSLDGFDLDISVIVLAGDRGALGVAPELAVFAAMQGLQVEFVIGTEHESVEAMRLACAGRERERGEPRENLVTRESPAGMDLGGGLIVTLAVIDPLKTETADWSHCWPAQGTRSTVTVLAVSAGYALAEQLAVVADAAANCQHPLSGVVVVDPDPADCTTGRASAQ
jgi:capsular polysaccharide biosynthesis protein